MNYIDERIVLTAQAVRNFFDLPVTINNYHAARNFSGFHPTPLHYARYNITRIYGDEGIVHGDYINHPHEPKRKVSSAHCSGRAIDILVKGLHSDEVKVEILKNLDMFPDIRRLEMGIEGWTHIDCNFTGKNVVTA